MVAQSLKGHFQATVFKSSGVSGALSAATAVSGFASAFAIVSILENTAVHVSLQVLHRFWDEDLWFTMFTSTAVQLLYS